jgi:hypothetical protein
MMVWWHPCQSLSPPTAHPQPRPHSLQLRQPARLASIDRGFRLSAVVYVKIASVSGWIRVGSPHDASKTRLCFSRQHDAGECLTQAAACSPGGQVRACGRRYGMPAVLATGHPPIVHTHCHFHALQRRTPALLASAESTLLMLAPVSGWFCACSAGCCLFFAK